MSVCYFHAVFINFLLLLKRPSQIVINMLLNQRNTQKTEQFTS